MAATAEALVQEEELLTFEEFAALELDHPADLVEGRMVPMPRNNPTHSRLVARLGGILDAYSIRTTFGEVYAGDVAVITKRDPDTGRGADVAVASHETLKDQPPNAAALQVLPQS